MKVINKVAQALYRFNSVSGDPINPRAIEFVLHYIKGSQTPMTLTDDEIEATKGQILRSLKSDDISYGEASITVDADTEKGIMDAFLTGKTTGLVGGFDYTIDENMIAHCIDTWDFNTNNCFCLIIYIPKPFVKAVKMLTKKLGIEDIVNIYSRDNVDRHYITMDEGRLAVLNDKHAFTTTWEIDFTGETCPIDFYQYNP